MKINNELDYSTRDYEGFRTDMINGLQKRIPEYTDTSQSDAGIVLIELLAHGLDLLSYYNDKTANEVYLDTAQERKNIINLAKMMGYVFNDGRPSEFQQVFEILPQEREFVIPRGYIVKTTENSVEESVLFETMEDLVIPPLCTGLEKDSEGNYLYTAPIVQGYSVNDETVGTSTGLPNQSFTLSETPVIKDSISLMITEANGDTEEWTRVENFLDSSPTDKHFTVTIDASDKGIINFGNGNSGMIPTISDNGIVASYRVGGGEIGNVSAYTINQVEQKLAGLVSTFNPTNALVLGIDKEDNETIKAKAKSSFKSTWGAITLSDYEDIARTFEEILDAKSSNGTTAFDVIINLLPKNYAQLTQEDLNLLKRKLMDVYRQRKVIGVDVYIEFAEKVGVNVDLDIILHPNVLRSDVSYLVDSAIRSSFQGDLRLLGDTIHTSEIIMELMQIEGVKSVNCTIHDLPSEITANQVVYIDSYTLNMTGGI